MTPSVDVGHARQVQAAVAVLTTPAARDPRRLARYAPFLTHPAVNR